MDKYNKTIRLNLGITKVYLIQCNNGYLLIDTGYSKDYQKFLKEMNKIVIKTDQINYLLLTHYHDDHAGFARQLKDEFNINLIVQEKSINHLKEGDSGVSEDEYPLNRRVEILMNFFMKFHKNFKFPPVTVGQNDYIVDGDDCKLLRKLGVHGDIIYTPGHTTDSMSVIMDNGDTFCGDVAMNFLRFTGIKHRPIYINSIEDVFKSWNKMLKKGAKTIYPAHGNAFPAENLLRYLKLFNKTEDIK